MVERGRGDQGELSGGGDWGQRMQRERDPHAEHVPTEAPPAPLLPSHQGMREEKEDQCLLDLLIVLQDEEDVSSETHR